MNWNKHIVFNLVFFKSTLTLGITVGVGIALYQMFVSTAGGFLVFVKYFLLSIPFGLIFDLLYKEITAKEQYYFFYNQGISKIELWIVSFVLSFSFYFLFSFIRYIWIVASKLTA